MATGKTAEDKDKGDGTRTERGRQACWCGYVYVICIYNGRRKRDDDDDEEKRLEQTNR